MKKFALLSHVLPPSPSGQSVMLYRILSFINPSDYYLIASRPTASGASSLPCQIFELPKEPELFFGIKRMRQVINLFVGILARARNLLAILRREPARAFVACSGDIKDIPAAFLACRIAGIPFYAYIFDDYVYQWTGHARRFAQVIAPFIFKRADGIIAPNEFICEEYHQRYGVTSALVRNPCDANELGKESYASRPTENGKINIIYTGAVYHANYDCFRNLLSAMDSLSEHKIKLHIYTAQTQEQLKDQGIDSDNIIIHSHVPYDETLEEQRKADLLFLPLAFDSPIPEVIRTSAPGKLGEYLASGRPILAHVPADSFVADYCRRHDCAILADTNNAVELARMIRLALTDSTLQGRIVSNAVSRARADFHPQAASEVLMKFLSR